MRNSLVAVVQQLESGKVRIARHKTNELAVRIWMKRLHARHTPLHGLNGTALRVDDIHHVPQTTLLRGFAARLDLLPRPVCHLCIK